MSTVKAQTYPDLRSLQAQRAKKRKLPIKAYSMRSRKGPVKIVIGAGKPQPSREHIVKALQGQAALRAAQAAGIFALDGTLEEDFAY